MSVRLGDKTGNFAEVIGSERGDIRFGYDENNSVYLVSKRTGTIFKSGLLFTGEPIRSEPKLSQPEIRGDSKGLLIVVGGIGIALLLMLAFVVWGNRQKAA